LNLALPVPARLPGDVKEQLLKLIDDAVAAGWSQARACDRLGVGSLRVHRWRTRLLAHGTLEDRAPIGEPVHRLLAWEEQAILELIETWGPVDRSHRKLAHRGSYQQLVWVAPSTVRRVAAKHQVSLPEPAPRRRPQFRLPWPDTIRWEPNQIWMWDSTTFSRCKRHVVAIVDVVSRYWIDHLCSPEFTTTQAQLLFANALHAEGLVELLTPERVDLALDDPRRPILVAWSDNGPQMTAGDTREFLALVAIWQHYGRPGTPTDQAEVESFFGHIKGDWPHLDKITDPAALDAEFVRVRHDYNTVRLHAGIGYVTPDDEHHGRGPAIRRARTIGLHRARQNRIDHHRTHRPESTT
jgi:transposase InsO family protein